MLTVDSITGGNREGDLRTGFSIRFRLTLAGMLQFAIKPMWGINYVTHEGFKLPQLDEHVDMSGGAISIGPRLRHDDAGYRQFRHRIRFCHRAPTASIRAASHNTGDGWPVKYVRP